MVRVKRPQPDDNLGKHKKKIIPKMIVCIIVNLYVLIDTNNKTKKIACLFYYCLEIQDDINYFSEFEIELLKSS